MKNMCAIIELNEREISGSRGGKAVEQERIVSLRMARQGFAQPVGEREYPALYRDMQPGRNIYWNGFGQPPTLTPRAAFDDGEYMLHFCSHG